MALKQIDIVIEKGEDFDISFAYTDSSRLAIDLTGYTARLKAWHKSGADATFLDLTTENGGLSFTELNGIIHINISSAITSLLSEQKGIYVLELYDTSSPIGVTKFARGTIKVLNE